MKLRCGNGKMTRIEREKRVVARMVAIYCRGKEGNERLCGECEALLAYAHQRLTCCPHGNAKPSCRKCSIHCYRPEMKAKIRAVMRYSGPRMLLRAPLAVLAHMMNDQVGKRKLSDLI